MTEKENVLKFMQYIEKLAKDYELNLPNRSYDIYAFAKDLLVWLEKQRDKDKLIQELGEYKVKYTQEVLEKYINSMSNKDDERLRKTAIAFLKDFAEQGYENAVECIDWLEKQGKETSEKEFTFKALPRLLEMIEVSDRAKAYTEKLAVALDNEGYHTDAKIVRESIKIMNGEEVPMATMDEQKPVDNIEPKFKVGDWIMFYGSNPFKILKIEADINGVLRYLLLDQNGHDFYFSKAHVDKNVRLWTIQDAKDGDVLVASDGSIFLFAGVVDCACKYYVALATDGYVKINKEVEGGYWETSRAVCPATKEQRDTLMKAMNNAGYKWDADKKELKKLFPNRFDPKTLQPFDKVLVRDYSTEKWTTGHFSYIEYDLTDTDLRSCDEKFKFLVYTSGLSSYWCAVPYNDETKHLVGTTEEVPEYYRYWED